MPFGPKISAFLAAIRVMPNVTRAAHAAKINKSQHYAKLKSSAEYAATFRQALQMGLDALSDVAVTRATDGWEEPLVYQGKIALREVPGTGKVVPVSKRQRNPSVHPPELVVDCKGGRTTRAGDKQWTAAESCRGRTVG